MVRVTGVREYYDALPDERKNIAGTLHALVMALYPEAQVDMSYKMPTYRVKSGWVAIANQKNHVSLYTCSAEHLAEFREKFPAIKTGKGCINFKNDDVLPEDAIRNVIRHAIENPAHAEKV